MTTRQAWWRIALWTFVAVWFAVAIWTASLGYWTMLVGFATWPVVGAIILAQQPRNGVGWFLLGIAAYAILMGVSLVPGLMLALPVWVELVTWSLSGSFWLLIPVLALVFPSGRLQTRLARVTVWVYALDVVIGGVLSLLDPTALQNGGTDRANPLGLPALQPIMDLWRDVIQYPAFIAVFVLALVDLVRRWRRAGDVERLQYRWLVFGVGAMVGVILVELGIGAILPDATTAPANMVVTLLALDLPPVTIGIAITRHGLYSIGRVVSRTVTYAVVLLVLLSLYVGIVIGIGALVPDESPVPVALATVAAAAAFLPLLRWVQHWVDRRFDRAHYNAERVVETFGATLQAGLDPETTVPELAAAVDQALRPASFGVWVRPTSGGKAAGG